MSDLQKRDQKELRLSDFGVYARPRSITHRRRWILCEVLAWGGVAIGIVGACSYYILSDRSPQLAELLARFSFLLVPFFPMFRRLAARFRVDSLQAISTENRSPILYLRPFSQDLRGNPYGLLKRPTEMILRSALKSVGPLVAVGKPDEALPPLGAVRIYLPQVEWQERVAELMDISKLVIIETGNAPLNSNITYKDYPEGLTWEMSTATSRVQPAKLLVSFFYTQTLNARSRIEELEAFKFLAESTWGFQIPDLPKDCYFLTFKENLQPDAVTLPRWKQLLFGRRTVAGVREALRPVLRREGIQLPYFPSYIIGVIRLAFICFLAFLVFYNLAFLVFLPILYGLYRLALHNLEGGGVVARGNKLLIDRMLKVE